MASRYIDATPVSVGSVLVQRVQSSSALYRAVHNHYWRGYLVPLTLPVEQLATVGKLIEVRTKDDFDAAVRAYKAQMEPGSDTRLAYYEVVDAGN